MRGPAPHTAEDASPQELRRASARLLVSLVALGLVVFPLVREIPVGMSGRTGVLAWLLVALALYWLYAGLGYRALLLLQVGLFSAAATLVSAKVLLVVMGVRQFGILRDVALGLVVFGTACAVANLTAMFTALLRRLNRPHNTA